MNAVVAVTGAEGFIGSHLVEALVRAGFRVRAMVLYNSFGSWGWLEQLPPDVLAEVDVVLGDVRDPLSVREVLRGAEVVYHLAALIAIPYSYRAPHSYVQTNVVGTLNVLEAVRELETPRLIHTSTSEVYGTARQVPIRESHPLQAQSPYAASKVGADKLVESYHLSFGLPAVTLRPFNTFGPRQSARAVIPTVISQIAARRDVIKVGSLAPTRDFNYVADTAQSFLAVGTAPAEKVLGRTLNTGTGVEVSVGALVEAIADVMGARVEVEQEAERMRPDASEVMRLISDSSALRDLTGWQPAYTLHAGLEQTSQWFLHPANLAHYRPGQYAI
ncbi:UDP-glucose 4-epimerase [Deinococcus metalli]|uniref:UDP-glucose 4-epimerase n=1 Tax=Deinococcus metalli TaxID=1141878 RepID=A0A7W8NMI5_9DEIO|nr:GDP-mannose 4,6-dehydratase [Deinococcus metalli]MBB5375844.1 UDP-glucose 4-epimerase [Deinococcus metalli]GHF36623.1 UDP-glucose 4-epimerase [Deinococcus metalli]